MITRSFSREAIALGMPPGDHDHREEQILDPTGRSVTADWHEEGGVDVCRHRSDRRIAEIIYQKRARSG